MRRNLKIYWLNFIVVLGVLAGSAVWQAREPSKSTLETPGASPDGCYHWADVERDVLMEIKDGEYTETEQTGESALREVVSSGYCFQSDGRILLSERETDRAKTFEPTVNGIRELDARAETPREFERCVHASALIERGENPYSVDGVRLGMSKADVEATWGALSVVWCARNAYCGSNGSQAHLDNSGRVHYVSGITLYEFSRPLSTMELKSLGHPDPTHPNIGSSGLETRVVGDYRIAIVKQEKPDILREHNALPSVFDPFEVDRMPEGRSSVSLGYRH